MKNKGFTLIELLVVVAIIGILSSIVLSSLSDARASARDAKRLADIKTIQNALEVYYLDNGNYPITGWRTSHLENSWDLLEAELNTTLPEDPLNNSTSSSGSAAASGAYAYGYFTSSSSDYCNGQAYMLVFNLENKNGDATNDGIQFCHSSNAVFTYTNSFVVGMNSSGNLKSPDLSGTAK